MRNFSPIVNQALYALLRNASTAEKISSLEECGWEMETLAQGVTRYRHPLVDVQPIDVGAAIEIQKILQHTGEKA